MKTNLQRLGDRRPEGPSAHIEEPSKLEIPSPDPIPIYMNFSNYLLTTDDEIHVVSSQSSGEGEYVLLCKREEIRENILSG